MTDLAWDHVDDDAMRQLGSRDPVKPTRLHAGLGAGHAVLRYLYDRAQIDDRWSVRELDGFTWWGHHIAQRVTSEPGRMDNGSWIERIVVRTDLLRDVRWEDDTWDRIRQAVKVVPMAMIEADPDRGSVGLVSTSYVYPEMAHWTAAQLAFASMLVVAEAPAIAGQLLAALGSGGVAWSEHPVNGPRKDRDDMLGIAALARRQAEAGSAFTDGSLDAAMDELEPLFVHAVADPIEPRRSLPFGDDFSVVNVSVAYDGPMGPGLCVGIRLPPSLVAASGAMATEMNAAELTDGWTLRSLGNWDVWDGQLCHISYVPTIAHEHPRDVVNHVMGALARNAWAAKRLVGDGETLAPGRALALRPR